VKVCEGTNAWSCRCADCSALKYLKYRVYLCIALVGDVDRSLACWSF